MKRNHTPKPFTSPAPISPLFLVPPNPLFEEADSITQQIMRSMKKYLDKLDTGYQPTPEDKTLDRYQQAMRIASMASRNYALSDRRNNSHLYRAAYWNKENRDAQEIQRLKDKKRADNYALGQAILRATQPAADRIIPYAQGPQPDGDPAAKEPI